jgi:uncharacterized protein
MTLDTSAILALLNRKDQNHHRVRAVIESRAEKYIIPTGILME